MRMNTYNIKRVIRTSCVGKSRFYLFLRYLAHRNEMDAVIYKYLGENISKKRKLQLKSKMREAMIKYRWDFNEFFMFHFESITEEEKCSFVPEFDKNIFCDLINEPETADIFLDKWQTYLHYSEFFKRDIINIRSLTDIESKTCTEFLNKHSRFMLKPVFEALGHGIQIIENSDINVVKQMLAKIYNSGTRAFVLEELIIQDSQMAALHPSSVNTLRIRTVNINGRILFIHPSLRMGRSNSFIDNAGAGGIIGNIDVRIGVVYEACDKVGHRYNSHPDTGTKIIGYVVPRWEEALETAKKMALKNTSVKYVGWDLALSKEKGWVMIEGNDKGQWGFQYVDQKGFRNEMNAILRELGKKEIH